VTWTEAPFQDVLLAFAIYSGKSIVPGDRVTGTVTADINNQPWDVALRTILEARGLVAVEDAYGIISVDDIAALNEREAIEPVVTRAYRISFARAAEIQAALSPLLSERGSMSVSESTNTVIVTDIGRVHRAIGGVIRVP
jgi:type IV pilus assembly protein PilQ